MAGRTPQRPALRQRTQVSATIDFERTLVHDDARGVYLLTARRCARQPTDEHIQARARYFELRNHPESRVVVQVWTETLLQRLARIRRRLEARKAAARAAMPARLDGLSS
jgi:hypothetical protein